MDMSHGASQMAAAALSPVQLAKAALHRLALDKVEPTAENYARASAAEGGHVHAGLPETARPLLQRLAGALGDDAGDTEALVRALMAGQWDAADELVARAAAQAQTQGQDWAELLQRLAQGLERGSRLWTAARKKDSLARVLAGSRSHPQRLRERARTTCWQPGRPRETNPACTRWPARRTKLPPPRRWLRPRTTPHTLSARDWSTLVHSLEGTVRAALPEGEPRADGLAQDLMQLSQRVAETGATPQLVQHAAALCERARRMLAHRQHLLDELGRLCIELTQGLSELAEDDSWAHGQCEALQLRLTEGLNVRSVRAASELLANARKRQAVLRGERNQARDAPQGADPGHAHRAGRVQRAHRPLPRQRRAPCRGDR